MPAQQPNPSHVAMPVTYIVPIESLPPKKRWLKRNKNAVKRPAKLPINWHMYTKVRRFGSSVGHIDKYYRDPKKLYIFRSMVEVLAFLRDKTPPKRAISKAKSKAETPTAGLCWGVTKKRSAKCKKLDVAAA